MDQVIIWDVVKGGQASELPIQHAPIDHDGHELLAINTDAEHALVRSGRELTIWRIAKPSPTFATLPMKFRPALYAISPSGERLAWARQNEFIVISIKDWKKVIDYPITNGGGHEQSLKFIEGPKYRRDMAVFASWSANQVMAMSPMARKQEPHYQ